MAIAEILNITLFVKDLQKSTHFYTDILGFKAEKQLGNISLEDKNGVHIVLQLATSLLPPKAGNTIITLLVDGIDGLVAEYKKKGVVFTTGIEAIPYGLEATFKDPDGYLLRLSQPT